MRLSTHSSASGAGLLAALLLPSLAAAATTYDCKNFRIDGKSFDLSPLGGPHSVMVSQKKSVAFHNTTYTIDICRNLKRSSDALKEEQCPNGSRVCAIEHIINPGEGKDVIASVKTIAGEIADHGGGKLDATWERLANSPANSDLEKEGLRLELHGGMDPLKGPNRVPQQAIVEFVCDRNRTGLEGNYEGEDKYEKRNAEDDNDGKNDDGDGNDGEDFDDGEEHFNTNSSLRYVNYDPAGDVGGKTTGVLRLEWRTKYACETNVDGDDGGSSSKAGWGFFTWFIIIAFLATAAYLIFGSWLNYTRYGARGWDLLPHGDTIRDVPYLLRDWMRRVVNTVQGSGSRKGYAAV